MPTLPELLAEDVQEIDAVLKDFLAKSEATVALITAEGGFLVAQQGDSTRFDCVTLGALSANAFNAAQAISTLLDDAGFSNIYQQGARFSLLASAIDGYNTLVVLFPSHLTVGAVKFFAAPALVAIARQFKVAAGRPSNKGIDLAVLNLTDSTELFRRKSA